tara:strand:- start:1292 stop:3040 length:1749 start_codon:yes stop_codon:yes gene_type:complete
MDDEFLKEIWEQFSIEVDEHCSNNEEILIGATSNELSEEQVNSAFRAFHTIKGLSRSLSLSTLEKIAHSAEDVLGDVREGKFKLDDDAISVLLKANDQMRVISENSAKKMLEVADDPKELIINLNEIREREFDGKNVEKDNEAIELSDEKTDLNVEDETIKRIKINANELSKEDSLKKTKKQNNTVIEKEKSISVASEVIEKIFSRTGNVLTSLSDINRIINSKLLENPQSDLKIAKDLIEKSNLQASLLNEEVLDLRVFPMTDVMRRVKRSGFEAARSSGKKVDIIVNGETSRADRNVVRAVTDPLMHIVRNAVDHGIEPPTERGNKDEKGKVEIDISTSSSGLEIVIKDDGRGIDTSKILEKAITNGLVDREKSKQLKDEEIFDFIFHPGFSTAEKVTDTSGRGVGMDVVKTNVISSGGSVYLNSDLGKGTKFTIIFPQITNTENCIVLESVNTYYAIPSRNVVSIYRTSDLNKNNFIEKKKLQIENKVYQIINFEDFAFSKNNDAEFNYLIVNFAGKGLALQYAGKVLIRDLVFDEPDKFVSSLPYISGAAISDGNKVVFQIDLMHLFGQEDPQKSESI